VRGVKVAAWRARRQFAQFPQALGQSALPLLDLARHQHEI